MSNIAVSSVQEKNEKEWIIINLQYWKNKTTRMATSNTKMEREESDHGIRTTRTTTTKVITPRAAKGTSKENSFI